MLHSIISLLAMIMFIIYCSSANETLELNHITDISENNKAANIVNSAKKYAIEQIKETDWQIYFDATINIVCSLNQLTVAAQETSYTLKVQNKDSSTKYPNLEQESIYLGHKSMFLFLNLSNNAIRINNVMKQMERKLKSILRYMSQKKVAGILIDVRIKTIKAEVQQCLQWAAQTEVAFNLPTSILKNLQNALKVENKPPRMILNTMEKQFNELKDLYKKLSLVLNKLLGTVEPIVILVDEESKIFNENQKQEVWDAANNIAGLGYVVSIVLKTYSDVSKTYVMEMLNNQTRLTTTPKEEISNTIAQIQGQCDEFKEEVSKIFLDRVARLSA